MTDEGRGPMRNRLAPRFRAVLCTRPPLPPAATSENPTAAVACIPNALRQASLPIAQPQSKRSRYTNCRLATENTEAQCKTQSGPTLPILPFSLSGHEQYGSLPTLP